MPSGDTASGLHRGCTPDAQDSRRLPRLVGLPDLQRAGNRGLLQSSACPDAVLRLAWSRVDGPACRAFAALGPAARCQRPFHA